MNCLFLLLTALMLLWSAVVAPFSCTAAPARQYKESELALITRLTARTLEKNHYRRQPIDRGLGEKLFDRYFDELDPARTLFTAEDIRNFAIYRPLLGNMLKEGDNRFPFLVYRRFQERYQQFFDFAEKTLKTPFDFTVDESFVPDRTKLPRPADDKELQELWRKRLKNDVLYYRLLNRAMTQDAGKGDAEAKKYQESAKLWKQKAPEDKVLLRLRDLRNEICKKEPVDILESYLNTLAQVYGPHSNYMAPKHDEDFEINMSLSLTGIGATLASDNGMIRVVALTPGGPAAKDGRLKVDDRIVAVTQENGETIDLIDMPVSRAVQYIRGKKDTKVTLTVIPGEKGMNAAPVQITIVRKEIDLVESSAKGEVRTVSTSRGNRRIGVITLRSFYADFDGIFNGKKNARRCSRDVANILGDFQKQNVDGVLIDLRRNGGGSLVEAIQLAGMFLTTGPVVQMRDVNRKISLERDADSSILYSGPLVVLTSKLSASASEIFTAALRDASRAVVVGDTRTFGKGTILKVERFELPRKFFSDSMPTGSLTYESSVFYRPRGDSVQQLGIEPDIVLPSITEEMEIGEMFLTNHLPWDSIKAVSEPEFDPALGQKAAVLRAESAKRVAKDPEYAKLNRQIKLFRTYRNRKSVSLNEAKRWQEYEAERAVSDAAEAAEDEDLPEGAAGKQNAKGKKKSSSDPVLREAERITADLAGM